MQKIRRQLGGTSELFKESVTIIRPALGQVGDVVVLDDKVPEVVLRDGAGPGLLLVVPAVQLVLVLSCNT